MARFHSRTALARRSRSAGLSALGLAALLVLTACGGGDSDKSATEVASLPTSAATPKDPAAAPVVPAAPGGSGAAPATSAGGGASDGPVGGRPQRRLDTSEEEEKRMWAAYNACLTAKGVDTQQSGSEAGEIARNKRYAREFKECEIKLPLLPPEMDPKSNPKYNDGMRDWVKCMTARGVKTKLVSGGWEYLEAPAMSQAQQLKIEQECKMEAFGGKR